MPTAAPPTHPPQHTSLQQVSDELSRMMRVLHALKNAAFAAAGPDQARERAAHVLLFPLSTVGPLRQGVLAEHVHIDPSTISRHVSVLVDRGYVRRVADASDGRASRLVITDDGAAVVAELQAERTRLVERVTAAWTPAEVATFGDLLHRFVDGMTDDLATYPATSASRALTTTRTPEDTP